MMKNKSLLLLTVFACNASLFAHNKNRGLVAVMKQRVLRNPLTHMLAVIGVTQLLGSASLSKAVANLQLDSKIPKALESFKPMVAPAIAYVITGFLPSGQNTQIGALLGVGYELGKKR